MKTIASFLAIFLLLTIVGSCKKDPTSSSLNGLEGAWGGTFVNGPSSQYLNMIIEKSGVCSVFIGNDFDANSYTFSNGLLEFSLSMPVGAHLSFSGKQDDKNTLSGTWLNTDLNNSGTWYIKRLAD
jgi:hypothetical protein